ncbi:hypothetical protein ATANTOWER_022209 [Ataeniobius toweri]|uniref:Uncharacterized protein n=1 Tax=Ataeniobius toweri TaxID=208326 RepID=A0ABU7BCE1_9TELE|nr:hypothetical protein [Ataeniobius toweri]
MLHADKRGSDANLRTSNNRRAAIRPASLAPCGTKWRRSDLPSTIWLRLLGSGTAWRLKGRGKDFLFCRNIEEEHICVHVLYSYRKCQNAKNYPENFLKYPEKCFLKTKSLKMRFKRQKQFLLKEWCWFKCWHRSVKMQQMQNKRSGGILQRTQKKGLMPTPVPVATIIVSVLCLLLSLALIKHKMALRI